MEKFTTLTGLVVPLDRPNVDTDAIIPKQFLKSIQRTGFGPNLFDEWRYLDSGEPGMDNSSRPLNTDFVLNQPRYQGATILLGRKNFGCGSSREHAPIALGAAGVQAVVAQSYARIFFRNCINLGLPAIVCPEAVAAAREAFSQARARGYGGQDFSAMVDVLCDTAQIERALLELDQLGLLAGPPEALSATGTEDATPTPTARCTNDSSQDATKCVLDATRCDECT